MKVLYLANYFMLKQEKNSDSNVAEPYLKIKLTVDV